MAARDAWKAMAQAAVDRKDYDLAHAAVDAALADHPDDPTARAMRLSLRSEDGYGAEAVDDARWLAQAPGSGPANWSVYLTALKGGEPVAPEAFAAEHRRIAAMMHAHVAREPAYAPHAAGSRRRIGLFGFEAHYALTRFLPPVLEHAPRALELVLVFQQKSQLEWYRKRWPRHKYLLLAAPGEDGAGAAATSARIATLRQARLDVLVDLAGHGPHNGIPLMAARVAPVQLTWLDYLATTGLATVEGRITDAVADPDGNQRWHSETLLRLPSAAWCYSAWAGAPPVQSPRADAPIRIGCAAIPNKLNAATLAALRATLAALPTATLTLFGFRSQKATQRVRDALGDAAARVQCLPFVAPAQYVALLGALDVVVDPVGFSGGTATMDALWQGVPVVTAPLTLSHTRSSASLLATAGLHDDVARSVDALPACAVAAVERDRAQPALRAGRRKALAASPLVRGELFAKSLFDAIERAMSR